MVTEAGLLDCLVYLVTASKNLDLTGSAGLIVAVRARERAGYSESTAKEIGCENLILKTC